MKKKITVVIIAAALIGLLVGAYFLYNGLKDELIDGSFSSEENSERVNFTVYDKNGEKIQLSDFEGKPVVLNFWASWCGICDLEMPDFEEKYKEYGSDVAFVMVNLTDGYQETEASANKYLKEKGYSFPVYFDKDGSAAREFSVYGIPVTYLIDSEGNIVGSTSGYVNSEKLQSGIDMLLKEKK